MDNDQLLNVIRVSTWVGMAGLIVFMRFRRKVMWEGFKAELRELTWAWWPVLALAALVIFGVRAASWGSGVGLWEFFNALTSLAAILLLREQPDSPEDWSAFWSSAAGVAAVISLALLVRDSAARTRPLVIPSIETTGGAGHRRWLLVLTNHGTVPARRVRLHVHRAQGLHGAGDTTPIWMKSAYHEQIKTTLGKYGVHTLAPGASVRVPLGAEPTLEQLDDLHDANTYTPPAVMNVQVRCERGPLRRYSDDYELTLPLDS